MPRVRGMAGEGGNVDQSCYVMLHNYGCYFKMMVQVCVCGGGGEGRRSIDTI